VKVCTVCGTQWPDDTNFCPNDGATLRAAAGGDLVGSVLADRYRIERKLGEGGMGAVYLGEHVKMRRKSAIKVLTKALAHDADAVARFNREAANAARINHSNVCAIYDFGETSDGLIYLAMEYIEGETLNELLRREGPLPPRRAARLLGQAGDALQAAHDLGIVHRDLKPDNIMVTHGRDGADVVKVVDFGIAKAIGGEEGQKVTKTGLVIGTPEYMSPEQLSGDVLDGRSDIYSLALVLFRTLAGDLPFPADTAQEALIKRLTDEPLKLAQVYAGGTFSDELQQAMDRALERMPGDRYASAAAFVQDVRRAIEALPEAPAAEPPRRPGATQLIDAAATEALPATRVSDRPRTARETPDTPRYTPQMTRSPVPARKKRPVVAIAAALVTVGAVSAGAAVMIYGGGEEGLVPADSSVVLSSEDRGTAPNTDLGGTTGDTSGAGDQPDSDTVGGPRPDDGGSTPPAPDVQAIQNDLVRIGRSISNAAGRESARTEAIGHYNDDRLPSDLRASFAQIVAEAYGPDNDGVKAEACRWIARAIDLDRGNQLYRQAQTVLYECEP
jgi:serine/threonine-protein kinase